MLVRLSRNVQIINKTLSNFEGILPLETSTFLRGSIGTFDLMCTHWTFLAFMAAIIERIRMKMLVRERTHDSASLSIYLHHTVTYYNYVQFPTLDQ